MRIKKVLIILTLIIILLTFIFLYNIYKDSKTTIYDHYSYLYNIFDNNLKIINSNMDKIAIKDSNEWIKLKEVSKADELKLNTYNNLIKDINECYKYYMSDKSIQRFKTKEEINMQELKEIQDINCLNNFKEYENQILSQDEKENIRLKTQISIMIDYNEDTINSKTFETELYLEVIRTNIILNLTKWLELEYNSSIN